MWENFMMGLWGPRWTVWERTHWHGQDRIDYKHRGDFATLRAATAKKKFWEQAFDDIEDGRGRVLWTDEYFIEAY